MRTRRRSRTSCSVGVTVRLRPAGPRFGDSSRPRRRSGSLKRSTRPLLAAGCGPPGGSTGWSVSASGRPQSWPVRRRWLWFGGTPPRAPPPFWPGPRWWSRFSPPTGPGQPSAYGSTETCDRHSVSNCGIGRSASSSRRSPSGHWGPRLRQRLWIDGDLRPAFRQQLWHRQIGLVVAAIALGALGAAWEGYSTLGALEAEAAVTPAVWDVVRRSVSFAALGLGAAIFGLFGWLAITPRLITDEMIERRISMFFTRPPLTLTSSGLASTRLTSTKGRE